MSTHLIEMVVLEVVKVTVDICRLSVIRHFLNALLITSFEYLELRVLILTQNS